MAESRGESASGATGAAPLVQRYIEGVWNAGDLALIDALVAPDYVRHTPHNPHGLRGPEELRSFVGGIRQAFPDVGFSIEEMLEAENGRRVVVRWTARGTHAGRFMGARPTGRRVEVEGVCIYTLGAGQIEGVWAIWDALGMLEQLGLLPALG